MKELGPEVALQLRKRLAELDAADYVSDLPVGNPREVSGGEHFKIDLTQGYVLIFAPNPVDIPRKKGHVDWSKVNAVIITQIELCNE